MKIFRLFSILIATAFASPVFAQVLTEPTTAWSAKITTGLTYQQLLSQGNARRSVTIQNNNASDACYITVGGPVAAGNTTSTSVTINGVSMTAQQASILLSAGQAYTRYYPFPPNDVILGTCATTGDSIYVDTQ